jgi:hypothetical protein
MRRRRAERCVLRAEVALHAGFEEEARLALEEARQLDSSTPDINVLRERVSHLLEPDRQEPAPNRRRLVPVAACVTLAVGGAVAYWMLPPAGEPNVVQTRHADVTLPVLRDSVAVRQIEVLARWTSPLLLPRTAQPSGPVAFDTRAFDTRTEVSPPEPPVDTVVRLSPPPVSPLNAEPQAAALLPLSLPAPNPAEPPAVPAVRTTESRPPVESVSAPEPAPPPVDERAQVRSVLSRYEAAYSGLDAAAARAVWPTVDERALARAFGGLQSQRFSLGQCDVAVDGGRAHAECAGSASWTPKVGSGRTEPRTWAFDLRSASDGWKIVRADVR